MWTNYVYQTTVCISLLTFWHVSTILKTIYGIFKDKDYIKGCIKGDHQLDKGEMRSPAFYIFQNLILTIIYNF